MTAGALGWGLLGLVWAADPHWEGRIRATLGPEFDSNAPRVVQGTEDSPADGLFRLAFEAQGQFRPSDRLRFDTQFGLGAKRFFGRPVEGGRDTTAEDAVVADLRLRGQLTAGPTAWAAGQAFRISRLRGGGRNYQISQTELSGVHEWGSQLQTGITAEFIHFAFPTDPDFDHLGPRLSAFGRLNWGNGWAWTTQAAVLYRAFEGPGGDPALLTEPSSGRRQDLEGQAGTGLAWLGPVQVQLRYLLRVQRSVAGGDVNFDRHRVSGQLSVRLPGQVLLSALGSLQFNLGQTEALLAEADENQNSVQVQLRRPLSPTVSADLRYGLFFNQFQVDDVEGTPLRFERHTVFGGITVYLEGSR